MRAAHLRADVRPGTSSFAALVLSALGVTAATWLIVGSDGDSSQVRWPLVVLPVAVCALPVLVPGRPVRIGAAVLLAAWCLIATLSIGFLLWPALAALLVASVVREGS
jgi:hypothetical protein